jgi:hypothetical protein
MDSIDDSPDCIALTREDSQGRVYNFFWIRTCSMSAREAENSIFSLVDHPSCWLWKASQPLLHTPVEVVNVAAAQQGAIELPTDSNTFPDHRPEARQKIL